MFDEMRKNTKTVLWITVIAFIGGFIFLDLGTGGSLFQGGGGGQLPDEIGRINDTPISATAYEQNVAQQLQSIQSQSSQEIDQQLETLVRNQTWDNIVQQVLLSQEVERLDIGVTDQEVIHAVLNDPSPQWTQLPQLQTNGQFDLGKYQAFLRSPGVDTRGIEAQARATIPMQKLQNQLLATVIISEAELWESYRLRNEKVRAEYVLVSSNQFEVDDAAIPQETLRDYYQARREDYRIPPEAVIDYIKVPKAPSAQDSLEQHQFAEDILEDVRAGEDFLVMVQDYSEAPTSQRGGESASWIFPNSLPQPVRDAIAGLPVGEVSDVIIEPNGFHVLRVEEKEEAEGGRDRYKIADIFIPLSASPVTIDILAQRVREFAEMAADDGFSEAAEDFDLEVVTTPPFRENAFIPGLGGATQVGQFAFAATPGTISRPLDLSDSYVVVKLRERRDERIPEFTEVETRVRSQLADSLRVEQAEAHARTLLQSAQAGDSLRAIAERDTLATYDAPEPFGRLDVARGIGSDPSVVGPIFGAEPGIVPTVLTGRRGAFIVRVVETIPADREQFEAQKDELRATARQRREGDFLAAWQQGLREKAEVKDFRAGSF